MVRQFDADEGWGVLDGPDIPGGCRVHFSAVAGTGYRQLAVGRSVLFEAAPADQDGFAFRPTRAWAGADTSVEQHGSAAYGSSLLVQFDDPGDMPENRVT